MKTNNHILPIRCGKLKCIASIAVLAVCTKISMAGTPIGGYEVYDAVQQFNNLALHGDPIGFHLGVGQNPDQCRHYQGMARINGPDGTPYFVMTRSGNHTRVIGICSCGCDDFPGELLVVKMESRPRDEERMRSNKLYRGGLNMGDTPPPSIDRGVKSIVLNGASSWMHPGGGQIVGDVMAIPVEHPWPNDQEVSAISFYDVRNPENPVWMFDYPLARSKTGVVGLTRDPQSGKYLMVYTGGGLSDGEGNNLYFEESDFTDFFDPGQPKTFRFLDSWHKSELAGSTEDKWEKWQTIDFIRQQNGQLFLGMTDNTAVADNGDDWARLFQVNRNSNDAFSLVYRAERHMKLNDPDMGNAAAGAGFYVSPTGELILYFSEHDNDGPFGSVKCGEFRSIDVSRTGEPTTGRAWVEFYWDTNGWDDSSPNRSLMLDQADWSQENWFDMDLEAGWGDEADSLRFWVPPGGSITLYKNQNWGGDALVLDESWPLCPGHGNVRCISDLGSFGDAIHSVAINAWSVDTGGGPLQVAIGINTVSSLFDGPDLTVQVAPGTYFETVLSSSNATDVVRIEPQTAWSPVVINALN